MRGARQRHPAMTPLTRTTERCAQADIASAWVQRPDWLLIVHPDPLRGATTAALWSQLLDRPADAVSTGTDARDVAGRRPAASRGLVLVWLCGPDRFTDGWPGHRIIPRLRASHPAVDVVVWLDSADLDGRAEASRLGVTWMAHSDATCGVAAPDLRPCTPPHVSEDARTRFAAWFAERFGTPWRSWMAPFVAVIASGGPPGTQVAHLMRHDEHLTQRAAASRLRAMKDHLSGEIRGHEVLLARRADEVLRRLSLIGPINAEPLLVRPLKPVVRGLLADQELAARAGVSQVATRALVRLGDAVEEIERRRARCGRPKVDAWATNREHGMVAMAYAAAADGRKRAEVRSRLQRIVDNALHAAHDLAADTSRAQLLEEASRASARSAYALSIERTSRR